MKEIPPHWKTAKLEELINLVIGGDWGKHSDYLDKDFVLVHCIRASEIKKWEVEKGKTAALRKIAKTSFEKRKLIEGDILVEISGGGPEQPVGRAILIDKEVLAFRPEIPKVCTNFFRLIRLNSEISPKFINQYLQFFYKAGKTVDFQAGSNNLRNLKFKDYVTIHIPLPPLPEQHLIVAKIEELFSELDNAVENLKKAKEQLKVYRQAVLKWAFEGKLTAEWRKERESQNTEYQSEKEEVRVAAEQEIKYFPTSKLPKGWKWDKLGNHAFVTKLAGFEFTSHVKYKDEGEIPVIRAQNVSKEGFIERNFIYVDRQIMEKLPRSRVFGGEVLMVFVGAGLGNVGIVPKNKDFFLGPNVAKIAVNDGHNNKFIYYFLSSTLGFGNINEMSKATAQGSISMGNIREVSIPIVPIKEQNKIIQEIETRFSVADKLEQSIDQSLLKSEVLRQSILKRAFEGKLVEFI
jgi:type I restriction enzyme, S subunit